MHPSQVYRQSAYRSPQHEKRVVHANGSGAIEKSAQPALGGKVLKNAKSPNNNDNMKLIQNSTKSSGGMFKNQRSYKHLETYRQNST